MSVGEKRRPDRGCPGAVVVVAVVSDRKSRARRQGEPARPPCPLRSRWLDNSAFQRKRGGSCWDPGDGGRSHHQDGDESAEQGLASAAGVVHEPEEAEFAMFVDLGRRYRWVLPTHHYDDPERLIANLGEWVIRPAETKVPELPGSQSG